MLPEHCTNYNILDSPSRNYKFSEWGFCNGGGCCDNQHYNDHDPIDNTTIAPPDWKGNGWYRISGEAGTKIVDTPAPYSNCGTAATGFLTGGHPSPDEGMVTRTVYFAMSNHNYTNTVDVSVINCNNFYFVYYLVDIPFCWFGYCTE